MNFSRIAALVTTMILLMHTNSWAHPGHGTTEPNSVAHHLVEPIHCWWAVLFFVVGAAILVCRRSSQKAKAYVRSRRQNG